MNNLQNFKTEKSFIPALKALFQELNVPVNYVSDKPFAIKDILGDHHKADNKVHQLIKEIYVLGTIDDIAFKKPEDISEVEIQNADYDFIMVIGIILKDDKLPTRSELAELTRLANKAFNTNEKGNPVTVVFKYGNYLSLANTERQERTSKDLREGEKMGKVTLLRDIDSKNTHAGHIRILRDLQIIRSGNKAIDSFKKLYDYWHSVLNTSILNKKFYKELSDWYFWAINEVTFPSEPKLLEYANEEKYNEAVKEHRAKNVIRLLTRILFIWFIKEKGLIPEEIFDEKIIGEKYLDEFEPQKEHGLFAGAKHMSRYYRAILQNLFFATLNQTVGERKFRKDKEHMNVTQLMRYRSYLKNPDAFVELMESTVPFMNGGLFECLDKPHESLKSRQGGDRIVYIDGFSDRDDNMVNVPDFLFFDVEEEVDLSSDYGDKKYKKSKTKGLFPLLKSYKFTITENTPIEEDVALDPELLGKVFENLLASYNPETKTTARKQTGSFYTPREIVNYMVDESLIAYLKHKLTHEEAGVVELGKNQLSLFGNETKSGQLSLEIKIDQSPFKGKEEELDQLLHQLVSYSNDNPLEKYPNANKKIIQALDKCKILDPACGSGAFPMGILQKMVHILHKIDPDNNEWKERQISRVNNAIATLEDMEDVKYRDQSIKELESQKQDIEEAFTNNELDYGRKLFLIENCIFGVDIQPIATQISKLRFFISLVVDQKVDKTKENFGIRPLPNLETKFVAANTLIGIDKPKEKQGDLFEKPEIRKLEKDLQKVRQKLFSSKSPSRKRELREEDKNLREAMSELLTEEYGHDTARILAAWDPYDQNTSSPFFDSEWMFDIKEGFDVVIGNPPYINANDLIKKLGKQSYEFLKSKFQTSKGTIDIYILFFEFGLKNLNKLGHLIYISPNRYLSASYGEALRTFIFDNYSIVHLSDFSNIKVFEAASTYPVVSLFKNLKTKSSIKVRNFNNDFQIENEWENQYKDLDFLPGKIWGFLLNSKIEIIKNIIAVSELLSEAGIINATSTAKEADDYHKLINSTEGLKLVNTGNIDRYVPLWGINNLTDKGEVFINPLLDYNNKIVSSPRKKLYNSPKIIFAKIGLRAEAFYDKNGEFASINTNCIHSFKNGYKAEYITLWVNSKLYHFLFSCFFDGLKMAGGYLLYSAPNLKSTFIKKPSKNESILAVTLHDIQSYGLQYTKVFSFDDIIDSLVFNLYFPAHMEERGIDVQSYIERDIDRVMQGRDFESLSHKVKNEVIQQLHTTWTDPENEVVKRMAMFKEKSPDVLNVIMEG